MAVVQAAALRPLAEALESRLLLAFSPTPREQESLELINRMRMDPAAELDLILNRNDPDVQAALDQFHVNMPNLRAQWVQLGPAPPLAWNEDLYNAAREHSRALVKADQQSHQLPGEPSLRDRVDGQGYDPQSYLGENVYSFAESAFHAHAAFAIDWGATPSGIQRPPGHRQTMMDDNPEIPYPARQVGIGIVHAPAEARQTGPLIITQDFGAPLSPGRAYLLGTVRAEINNDGVYNAGEGLGGVSIRITGTGRSFKLTTMSAGAYQIRLPPGTYAITTSGGGLSGPMMRRNLVIGADNVKEDFVAPPDPVAPTARLSAGNVAAAGASAYTFTVTYRDNAVLRSGTIGAGDIVVSNGKGFRQTAALIFKTPSGNAASISAVYAIRPPGRLWDRSDNGTYVIRLLEDQVKDAGGNPVAGGVMGTFTVRIGAAADPGPQ